MTTVVVTGTVSGYSVRSPITVLSIAASGYVEGPGINGGASNAYTILNAGRVSSTGYGVYLRDGGVVTNGSVSDQTALIEGAGDGVLLRTAGVVHNYGTIISTYANPVGSDGVFIYGAVTNGSFIDTAARIVGNDGISEAQTIGTPTISNFGTVLGVARGVYARGSGHFTNGAATDTGAVISGGSTGAAIEGASVINNFGTLVGGTGDGLDADSGGAVTNGGPGDKSALIEGGATGVFATTVARETVTNFGAIIAAGTTSSQAGIYLGDGGSITNGSVTDHSALISGNAGALAFSSATVVNFGSIEATSAMGGGRSYGVSLYGGGSMTNGSVNDQAALISGYGGFFTDEAGPSINFGIVQATGGAAHASGIYCGSPAASFTNGAANDHAALIEGYIGADMFGGTLTNFGVILGVGGIAVQFNSSTDVLEAQAGSSFIGAVYGAGGTLDLASGVGTIGGLFSNGDVTVSGSMPITTFDDFFTLEIGTGASFTMTGTDTIPLGQSLIDNGSLTVTGALTSAGTLGGTGTLDFASGTDALTGGTLSTAKVNVTGAAVVTLSGKITLPSTVTASGKLRVANGTSLTGAGALVLSDIVTNEITGTSATSRLTNDTRVEGEGQIGAGSMELTNAASATIISLGAGVLTLNTGTSVILNAGVIGSEGTGGLTISSPIDNTGKLIAISSPLTVDGAVTGAGIGELESTGSLIVKGAFNENVTFLAASGTLELAHGQTYSGTISGFSKAGGTFLDLDDINSAGATATWSKATGDLTVKDGTHTAVIHLAGDYTGSNFVVADDGHGHALVHDPNLRAIERPATAPMPHAFIAAAAGFGASAAGPVNTASYSWRAAQGALGAPRTQIA